MLDEYYNEITNSFKEEIEDELENGNLIFASVGSSQPFLTDATEEVMKDLVKYVSHENEAPSEGKINEFLIEGENFDVIWEEMLDDWFGENAFKPYLTEKFIRR